VIHLIFIFLLPDIHVSMEKFDINAYIVEAESLEKLFNEFIDNCSTFKDFYTRPIKDYEIVNGNSKVLQRELLRRYEKWFAVTKLVVQQYSDRNQEFVDEYQEIKFIISLIDHRGKDTWKSNFIEKFDTQVNILHTIIPIIALQEASYKKLITADLINSELEQAEVLYDYEFYRAAGAVAGVVLERYLKTLCEVNAVPFNEKDTIDPLATKIYTSGKIADFDKTLLKSIQHIASIRNKCAHPEEPKPQEVRELIDKTKKITFLSI
jgi:hypothetical protein